MRRVALAPRPDWAQRCEDVGFDFHSVGGTYWDESAAYRFDAAEIDTLEAATEELHRLCLEACDHVVAKARYAEFAIPDAFVPLVEASWQRRDPSLFGRFDLAWDGSGAPRLLEYNADTPTALIEASVVQWHWLEDVKGAPKGPGADADQFNSLHEKLIERWQELRRAEGPGAMLHLASVRDQEEDYGNVNYLRDTAVQAGWSTKFLFVEDIGWDKAKGLFVDVEGAPIRTLFKLYPWEWLARESFAPNVLEEGCAWIEPPWKMLLSNKAILAVLWELFDGHPNLLPAYGDAAPLGAADYVKKPILAREGANVSLRRRAAPITTQGTYGAEGFVFQQYAPLARFERRGEPAYAVIGSWIVGDRAAGVGIREDDSPITTNTSRFVPHFFEEGA